MRDPWRTDENDFPDAAVVSERLRFLLNYAVLAPSSHNTQPWLFALEDESVALRADRTRSLPVVDPLDRELIMSCGAALHHLQVAIGYFGYQPQIDLLPVPSDPDLLARIRLGESAEATANDVRLFQAIQQRRTNRLRYDERRLPADLVRELDEAATTADVELKLVVDARVRENVATLISKADRVQFADPAFRRELSAWVHSKHHSNRDGMSAAGFGMPDVLSSVGAVIIRTFDFGRGVAAQDQKIAAGSPTLAILATASDKPIDWLRTGRFLSHVLLSLTAAGLSASYLNQPIELDMFRPRLRRVAAVEGLPQLLLRVGFGPIIEPSVRRAVEDVLLIDNT